MISSQTASFFSQNRKNLFFLGCTLLILLFSFDTAFAESLVTNSSGGSVGIIDVLQWGLKIIASLLWVLTTFVALFLNPEWTSGTAFGLQKHLKEIWILVSNVVYFVFALILIVIAFMNIIGKEWDMWALKSALPKLIVGILIVPFSWFFVQFVVSVSAVLTIGVLTLPYDTFKDKDFFQNINSDFKICTHPVIDLGSVDVDTGSEGLKQSYTCADEDKKTVEQILNGEEQGLKNGIFGIISIYTYGILGSETFDEITKDQLSSPGGAIKAILDLWVKAVFDLVFIIVYCILIFALFLALLTRWVWLWLYMMLSPAFWLLYFFWEEASWTEKFTIKEFIALALVPVYVSAALSFGLVFLFVASDGIKGNMTSEEQGTETLELAGLKLTIKWFQGKSEGGLMNSAGSALSTLIVEMFGIVILWIAVMAALEKSKITGAIIEPIKSFGTSVWQLAMKAPQYAPILPMPGWPQSAESLKNIGSTVSSAFSSQQTDKSTKFVKDYIPWLSWGIDLSSESLKAIDALKNSWNIFDAKSISRYRDVIMENGESSSKLSKDTQFVNLTKDMLVAAWQKDIAEKLQPGNATELAKAIGTLDELAKSKWGEIIISWKSLRGTLSATGLDDAIKNNGNLDSSTEAPVASATTSDISINIAWLDKTKVSFDSDTWALSKGLEEIKKIIGDEKDKAKVDAALTSWGFDDSQRQAILKALWIVTE